MLSHESVALDPFDFSWGVPVRGFSWEQAYVPPQEDSQEDWGDEPQWLLVEKGDIKRYYRPLEEFEFLGLFRVFTEVHLSLDGVLGFANEYGKLGIPRSVYGSSPWSPDWRGEILYDWARHIERMRQAVEISDLLRAGDEVGLRRLISQKPRTRPGGLEGAGAKWWFYRSHSDGQAPNVNPRPGPPWPGEFTDSFLAVPGLCDPGDVMTPARMFLSKWVTERLRGAASPQLCYLKERGQLNLQIIPNTLLSAMWLQLALAIDTDKTYRRCKVCSRWFELSAGNSRTDRQFCSDACKSRDYRSKKQEAIRLRDEKWTLQQIAKKLGTTPEVVKRWLNRSEGRQ